MISLRPAAVLVACSVVVAVVPAHADSPLPLAKSPEEVGLSSAQLARIEATTKAHIESGMVPGAVMLVTRKGKIAWHKTLGFRDRDANDPMKPDTIFRYYSMTKPVTSVAAMMLVEEGRLQISDPVMKFLPELAGMKVGTEKPGGDGKPTLEMSAPARQMTVQDLLRHTSGLTYGEFGNSAIHTAYREAKVGDRTVDAAGMVTALAKLPLRFSPGARWEYGRSTDVLGRVVEVIEGKPLSEVLAARLIRPLGMVDTAFHLPADKVKRAAQAWQRPGGPPVVRFFDVAEKPAFEGGGEGLVGTMDDYLRFCLMLANGGAWDGKRLLGKQTLAFMTSDHVGATPGLPSGLGFGLGFSVRTKPGEFNMAG
ncbi:MAG TPA: serine hydrolase domain-containing protein, partial [Vineibacter sp.]|nr:serine hydrolase domain-containing protein [Vineibacter sp.]